VLNSDLIYIYIYITESVCQFYCSLCTSTFLAHLNQIGHVVFLHSEDGYKGVRGWERVPSRGVSGCGEGM